MSRFCHVLGPQKGITLTEFNSTSVQSALRRRICFAHATQTRLGLLRKKKKIPPGSGRSNVVLHPNRVAGGTGRNRRQYVALRAPASGLRPSVGNFG